MKKELAIATITWVRDKEEQSLLQQSLPQLNTLDLPIYITDGGSDASFISFLEHLSNVVLLPKHKGLMGASIK